VNRLIVLLAVASFAARGLGAEGPLAWPQFRGPNGSGVADEERPPVEFGPDKNVRWKVPAPSGLSSPIVVGDLLVITAFEDEKLYTIAYRRADGTEAWRAEAPATAIEPYYPGVGSPASPTAATDGERIVAHFGSCGLVCYDLAGKELWKYEIPMSAAAGGFGTATSPILADGAVVLVRDEYQNSRILALDAASGLLQWETPRKSPASYCTPIVWDAPGGKQIAAAGHARLVGYDLASGEELWTVVGMPSGCCSSPVTADGALFFAGSSPGGVDDPEFQMPTFDFVLEQADKNADELVSKAEAEPTFLKDFFDGNDANRDGSVSREEWDAVITFMREGENGAFALRAGGTGDVTESHILWKQTAGLPYITSAIVYRGQYVMVRDGGIVTAYDAQDGAEVYRERAAASGSYYASPVAAGGNIYFTSLDEGVVTVLQAGSEEPLVVVENPPLGERVAATPAIADDTLYIRTEKHLYAFAEE